MSQNDKAGPYSIGSDHCPGLSKLAEEAGEVVQVVGKIIGAGGMVTHWDGSDLRERLEEEMADVIAACQFVVEANGLSRTKIDGRVLDKLKRFRGWHALGLISDPFADRRAANHVLRPGFAQFMRESSTSATSPSRWEFCDLCGKHVSHHFGGTEYRCDPGDPGPKDQP